MGAWNPETQSWDKEPGWLQRLWERVFRIPNVQRNRALGWRVYFKKYGGFSRPFPGRAEAEAAKKRIMAGEDIKAEFWGPVVAPVPVVADSLVVLEGAVVLEGVRFSQRGPFYNVASDLPSLFHRGSGHALVLREPREVRFFGDHKIAKRGLTINGHEVSGIEEWGDGWHGYFHEDVEVASVANEGQ